MEHDASTWPPVLSFRIDGLGNIALYDEMAEVTVTVETSDVSSDEAIHAQMTRMFNEFLDSQL